MHAHPTPSCTLRYQASSSTHTGPRPSASLLFNGLNNSANRLGYGEDAGRVLKLANPHVVAVAVVGVRRDVCVGVHPTCRGVPM